VFCPMSRPGLVVVGYLFAMEVCFEKKKNMSFVEQELLCP
jgi:hypothetical protein